MLGMGFVVAKPGDADNIPDKPAAQQEPMEFYLREKNT
jgi:hypothetical protein